MPIIIDEIVISVEVGKTGSGRPAASGDGEADQAIVQRCVERVLEILRARETP